MPVSEESDSQVPKKTWIVRGHLVQLSEGSGSKDPRCFSADRKLSLLEHAFIEGNVLVYLSKLSFCFLK